MADNSIEHLHYYQRQFLGAEDFAAEQTYHRDMRRRHQLAPHTWGIVTGLQLVEEDQEGGSGKDVYLQPGLAIDGYGREIVVLRRHKVDPAAFLSFARDDHYAVWIAYEEEEVSRVRPGYGTCDDQHNRVRETFRLFVEPEDPDDYTVVVDGETIAAGDESLPHDLSVPYQELPDDPRERWFIPLGNVRWDGGQFVQAAEGRLQEGRVYAGLVGAKLLAPAGALCIGDRATEPLTAADDGVAVTVEGTLQVERDVTAKADVHVDGGQLDFRHSDGGGGEAFALYRTDPGGGEELRLQVPLSAESDRHNRIAAGYDDGGDFAGVFFVTDEGMVGVRTAEPEHPLQIGDGSEPVVLSIRGPDNNAEAGILAFEDASGSELGWFRLVHDSDANRLQLLSADRSATDEPPIITFASATGHVGLSTAEPDARLHVATGEDVSLTSHGYLLLGAVDGRNIAVDNNEIQARDSGAAGTLHLQAEGGDLHVHSQVGENAAVLIQNDGNVGLGTNSPLAKLHIVSSQDVSLTHHGALLLGNSTGVNLAVDGNEIQARNNGAASTLYMQWGGGAVSIRGGQPGQQVVIQDDGDVGIGTTSPNAKLDVRGSVRLGSAGSLFAMGAGQELRVVAGTVSSGGAVIAGTGFTVDHVNGSGEYEIDFSSAFSSTPVVLVSTHEASGDDQLANVRNADAAGFTVMTADVEHEGTGGTLEDTSFSFIALGSP